MGGAPPRRGRKTFLQPFQAGDLFLGRHLQEVQDGGARGPVLVEPASIQFAVEFLEQPPGNRKLAFGFSHVRNGSGPTSRQSSR